MLVVSVARSMLLGEGAYSVMEVAIELQHVRVTQPGLDLHLAAELVHSA